MKVLNFNDPYVNSSGNVKKLSEVLGSDTGEIISDIWNSSKTYTVGEYCIYNNQLWKCKVQNSGVTPAENSYWTARKISDEIKHINEELSSLDEWIDVPYTSVNTNYELEEYFKIKRNSHFLWITVDISVKSASSSWNFNVISLTNKDFDFISPLRTTVNMHWDSSESSNENKLGIQSSNNGFGLLRGVNNKRYTQDFLLPIRLK